MSGHGEFFVVEGADGTGKSTQAELLVKRLRSVGRSAIDVHEPGSTPMAQELRRILLDGSIGRTAITNVLLFTAARAELWQDVIKPTLDAGTDVVADRHWLSSAAYQGHAEGMGISVVRNLTELFLPPQYVHPSLTALLLLGDAEREARLGSRGGSESDTFESRHRDFMSAVANGYVKAAVDLPEVVGINAGASIEQVHEDIWAVVEPVLTRQHTAPSS